MCRKAFTMLELLSVIAIIAILSALLFPVLGRAKQRSKEAVSISNLHQCSLALLIYASDEGGVEYLPPTLEAALAATSTAPTCSPLDYLGSGCKTKHPSPFLGSYGYVRLVPPFDIKGYPQYWNQYIAQPNATLLLDVFAGDPRLTFGNFLGVYSGIGPAPDYVIRARVDGSAGKTRYRTTAANGQVFEAFAWEPMFTAKTPYFN